MNVIWQPKALKHLKKIGDRSAQERILAATRGLAAFPVCPNIKSLTNHEYTHRLRVGNWRVFCSTSSRKSASSASRVKKRDEQTY